MVTIPERKQQKMANAYQKLSEALCGVAEVEGINAEGFEYAVMQTVQDAILDLTEE